MREKTWSDWDTTLPNDKLPVGTYDLKIYGRETGDFITTLRTMVNTDNVEKLERIIQPQFTAPVMVWRARRVPPAGQDLVTLSGPDYDKLLALAGYGVDRSERGSARHVDESQILFNIISSAFRTK